MYGVGRVGSEGSDGTTKRNMKEKEEAILSFREKLLTISAACKYSLRRHYIMPELLFQVNISYRWTLILNRIYDYASILFMSCFGAQPNEERATARDTQ